MTGERLGVVAFAAATPTVDAATRAAILPLAAAVADGAGGVLVATCHRVEVTLRSDALPPAARATLRDAGMTETADVDAARQVIGLAVGLRSAVLGEDQVLHQLRAAVADARTRGALGMQLDALMDHALRAGRLARSWRPAGRDGGPRSLGDAAVARVEQLRGASSGERLLIVGAGAMGTAAAVAARRAGARVAIASRTLEHARATALDHGADAWPMDPGVGIAEAAAVIVALLGPWQIGAGTVAALQPGAVVVDLSMPAAVPASLVARRDIQTIGIDDLAADPRAAAGDARYRERLDGLAERTLAAYLATVAERRRSAAELLARHVEAERAATLDAWLRGRDGVDPDARALLEELSRDLSARLFRDALARLAHDPDGRRRQALDELFGA